MRVLVAGASGSLGRPIVELLSAQTDTTVRGLGRGTAPPWPGIDEWHRADATDAEALQGAVDDVDVVVSTVGASVGLHAGGRASYDAVDIPANLNLLREAERAGAQRFVYVGVHAAEGYEHTRYVLAHEQVSAALATSDLSSTVVRPTGVFTAFDDLVTMAQRGKAQLIGDGAATTNPIHPVDVAEAIVAHLETGPAELSVGGPEVLTRRQIVESAFEAVGKKARISAVPPGVIRVMRPLIRLFHPRLGDLFEFAVEVSTHDAVAPVAGDRRLATYFETLVTAS